MGKAEVIEATIDLGTEAPAHGRRAEAHAHPFERGGCRIRGMLVRAGQDVVATEYVEDLLRRGASAV